MRRRAPLITVLVLLLPGCSSGGGAAGPTPTVAGSSSVAASAGNAACSGGLTGKEPGVVRITCDGTAVVRITAGGVSREMHGGVCHAAAGIWSAAVGVIIDATGTHGTYTGPAVDSVAVNDTSTPGRGTIQALLGGKHYFDLGNATMTVSADKKSAHLDGTGDRLSDAPNEKITVDVTC
jgi:hypothetical protein